MRGLFFILIVLFMGACSQPPLPQNELIVPTKEPVQERPFIDESEQKLKEGLLKNAPRVVPNLSERENIVKIAMKYLGKKDGKDCSGFVNLINRQIGYRYYNEKELSQSYDNARKSRAMFNLMRKKGNTFDNRLPYIGDLVFFQNTERVVKNKNKVAENITHVGIVTRVDSDGTVTFIHHSNGKNILDYMNFNYPKQTKIDDKKINTYMKRCSSKKGVIRSDCFNIAFFVAYGTF